MVTSSYLAHADDVVRTKIAREKADLWTTTHTRPLSKAIELLAMWFGNI
jgi:hypothetical protein